MSVSTGIPPVHARPVGSIGGQGGTVTIGNGPAVNVKEWRLQFPPVSASVVDYRHVNQVRMGPNLTLEQRQRVITKVREQWARVDVGNPVPVERQLYVPPETPTFNRPRRRISLQDE